ncbi:FecR protein [Planctomycetes bacterium Pan216]|uniref:FecR protein n=1 Tax=Kolteria novifilia TaxID=2527975 RepID=A0A518B451_9BACT|nr:FecR protein [Planctomycetes bacterium Pan216]
MKPEELDDLYELFDAVIEDRLTPEQAETLEQRVLGDRAVRRLYVEYMHQNASMLWWMGASPVFDGAKPDATATLRAVANEPFGDEDEERETPPFRQRMLKRGASYAAMLAFGLLLGVVMTLSGPSGQKTTVPGTSTVAELVVANGCKWDSATVSTVEGARLTAGRLHLAEGLARVRFDSGAEVALEAPAELEIISSMACVLHSGRLLANVPPQAKGFVVDTPKAKLIDHGTEFGVSVDADGEAGVLVFDGIVDVEHRATGEKKRMVTGKGVHVDAATLTEIELKDGEEVGETGRDHKGKTVRKQDGTYQVRITSAQGKGKDAYVQSGERTDHTSDILLLIKNDGNDKRKNAYLRKGYVGLDLSSLEGLDLRDARLTLTAQPSGYGFAATMPDSIFSVYGLVDESLDGWNEDALRWDNAPGNGPGGAGVDPEKVVKLGTFVVPRNVQHGAFSIEGPELVEFLNRDTNGIGTFLLVRDTTGPSQCLVHGFANKYHPTAMPPTLTVTIAGEEK